MIKAMMKKQMQESFCWLYQDKKTGKNRSMKGLIGYGLLYLLVFGCVGFVFYAVSDMLCEPFHGMGLDWLYIALMGLMSVMLGVFGSVFNTYTSLYRAKDNDFLLAMPIPTKLLLVARLTGVYAMGLLYEMLVMIPALIVYFMDSDCHGSGVVFTLLIPFVLSFFVLTLSCVLGWVVALISSRLRHKKLATVAISLVFIGAYYYFYGKAFELIQAMLANPDAVSAVMKKVLFPFYHMGMAAEGHAGSMLIFTVVMLGCVVVVYLILDRSFLRLATTRRGEKKKAYVAKNTKEVSGARALLQKEFRMFLGSPTYMLNCGLGILGMLICAIFFVIKQEMLLEVLNLMFADEKGLLMLVMTAGICMMTTMNDMTAPSVSLEGNCIWLTQSLPVRGWQVLQAKLYMHLILTLVPAAVVIVSIVWLTEMDMKAVLLMSVTVVLFVVFMAELGLVLNLRMPNLNWTSEIAPIKQSASVMICLFGGWALVIACGGLYYLLRRVMTPAWFLVAISTLLLIGCAWQMRWLRTRGEKIFEHLS